ncbi:hypothetical protein GCM10029976_042680 [Kribbella albertanoniae]|uniref:Uncharacterized protein n=1 Tax=Kribbella albertanoniae TaxID=1266829 RepID=A0A4R4QFX2_9ACTN|nr:hypothetical protein [Kribbella albertanoniae]TDC34052.1 hypothetical protein E1261_04925 [Kribbella albertanoniae]
MSDIQSLLNAAADDSNKPETVDIDTVLRRGRRTVRRRRIMAAAGVSIGLAAGAVGITAAPSLLSAPVPVAASGAAGSDTAEYAVKPPTISPLTSGEILRRCLQGDREALEFNKSYKVNTHDTAGPINSKWPLKVKTGVGDAFMAIFVSPDGSTAATCRSAGYKAEMRGVGNVSRMSTTLVFEKSEPNKLTMTQQSGIQVPENVARVLVSLVGEKTPREALMSETDGFYTIGWPRRDEGAPPVSAQVRGYDAKGVLIYDEKTFYYGNTFFPAK